MNRKTAQIGNQQNKGKLNNENQEASAAVREHFFL
jgi:hypothetical protein